MTRSRRRSDSGQEGGKRRASLALALVLPLFLAACGSIFGDDEEPQQVTSDAGAGEADFPQLSTVPQSARNVSSEAVRQQAVQGLAADRSNARYSNEPLTGSPIGASPPQNALPQNAPQVAAAPSVPPPPSSVPVPAPAQVPQAQQAPAAQPAPLPAGLAPLPPQIGTAQSAPAAPARQELIAVIFFGFGSSGLNATDMQVLRDVATLHGQRGGQILVVGHASSRTGTMSPVQHQMANFNISVRRANAVAEALGRLGVAGNAIRTEAVSDSQPVYHEFMPTGETGNQRAEIFFQY